MGNATTDADALRAVLDIAAKRRRLEAKRAELRDETYRVVLLLIDVHGIKQNDLARLLDVSEQRASQLVREARRAAEAHATQ